MLQVPAAADGEFLVDVAVLEEGIEEGLAVEEGDGGGEEVVAVDAEEG